MPSTAASCRVAASHLFGYAASGPRRPDGVFGRRRSWRRRSARSCGAAMRAWASARWWNRWPSAARACASQNRWRDIGSSGIAVPWCQPREPWTRLGSWRQRSGRSCAAARNTAPFDPVTEIGSGAPHSCCVGPTPPKHRLAPTRPAHPRRPREGVLARRGGARGDRTQRRSPRPRPRVSSR